MCSEFIMKPENVCLTNTNKLLPTPFSQAAPATFPLLSGHPRTSVLDRLTYKILGKIYLHGFHSPWPLYVFCTLSSSSTSGYAAPYVWNSLSSPCQATSLSPMKSLFLSAVPSTLILTFPLA